MESPDTLAGSVQNCPSCSAPTQVLHAVADSGADLQMLLEAAQTEPTPESSDRSNTHALAADKNEIVDHALYTQGLDEFQFPGLCARCGGADPSSKWTIRGSRQDGRTTTRFEIRVPICRSCRSTLTRLVFVGCGITVLVGLGCYFIPQSLDLQQRLLLVGGGLIGCGIMCYVIWRMAGGE